MPGKALHDNPQSQKKNPIAHTSFVSCRKAGIIRDSDLFFVSVPEELDNLKMANIDGRRSGVVCNPDSTEVDGKGIQVLSCHRPSTVYSVNCQAMGYIIKPGFFKDLPLQERSAPFECALRYDCIMSSHEIS
ncbi:hypothetical protein EDB81DRAFT_767126 [Dactylonectria macrodidyma]|uniref:Uncharacterized protein n=1 Tax=Dactylonectria macrodidyma TaxID=307937 RepID=A0A9P9ID73_9HYPO|nr:hypothetical protein EDB81DRAFT_767126 [Dactylonectria macrodidyma]